MDFEPKVITALYKISSALTNFDQISDDSTIFVGKINRDFDKFFRFFLHHTESVTSDMYQTNPATWTRLYKDFSEVDECVEAPCEETKHLGIMVAKLKSSLEDLRLTEKSVQNRLFVAPMISRLVYLVDKNYPSRYKLSEDGMRTLGVRVSTTLDKVLAN